jgi:putative oxidoreductase
MFIKYLDCQDISKYAPDMRNRIRVVFQVLVGLLMAGAGVMKFIKPESKIADSETLKAFVDSGWLWSMIGAAETVGGLAVLSGRYVPIGLAILTPIVAGIAAFAIKFGGEEASVGILLAIVHLYLVWEWRASFMSLFVVQRNPQAE